MNVLEELRAALREYILRMSDAYVGEGRWPLEKIRAKFEGDFAPYGVLEKTLLLDDPADGIPLLRQGLAHHNSIRLAKAIR